MQTTRSKNAQTERTTRRDIERCQVAGREVGHYGTDYQPWLKAIHFPSNGLARRTQGLLEARTIHFLSNLDTRVRTAWVLVS